MMLCRELQAESCKPQEKAGLHQSALTLRLAACSLMLTVDT
jgi:hypothetical protein